MISIAGAGKEKDQVETSIWTSWKSNSLILTNHLEQG